MHLYALTGIILPVLLTQSSRVARRPSLYRLLQRILSSPVLIVSRLIRPLAWTGLTVTFLKLQLPLYPLR